MHEKFSEILKGYAKFRDKYAHQDKSVLKYLSDHGQRPEIMVVSCCDSRVDPGLMLQCPPGKLFVVRNVANIVPPCELDDMHHGTSAALEFGVRFLGIKDLVILGHSQCGGIEVLMENHAKGHNHFISNWVSIAQESTLDAKDVDDCARLSLKKSYQNCLTFPWIKDRVESDDLTIHLWFFDIKSGQIFSYSASDDKYHPLEVPRA